MHICVYSLNRLQIVAQTYRWHLVKFNKSKNSANVRSARYAQCMKETRSCTAECTNRDNYSSQRYGITATELLKGVKTERCKPRHSWLPLPVKFVKMWKILSENWVNITPNKSSQGMELPYHQDSRAHVVITKWSILSEFRLK